MGGGSDGSPTGVASLVAHPHADAIFEGMVRLSSDVDLPAPTGEAASKKEASAASSASPPSFARAANPDEGARWHLRIDEILNRGSPRSPYGAAGSDERRGQPANPTHRGPNGEVNGGTGPRRPPRITLRRHSMEGDLSPFQALQLQRPLQSPWQQSPNGPPRQDVAAVPSSEPRLASRPPHSTASPANNASGGRPRRRHSMEGPPPPFARLCLQRCGARDSRGGVPTQSEAATARGSTPAALRNGRPLPQVPQVVRQGSKAEAPGTAGPQRRPCRRHSVDAPLCPPCPFQRPMPASHTSKQHPSKHSWEQTLGHRHSPEQWEPWKLEPSKTEGPPKELLVPRRMARGGAPRAPGSPSSMSNASSISNVSSIAEKRRRAAAKDHVPTMPVPVEPPPPRAPDGPFASPAGSASSKLPQGSPESKAGRRPPRRHFVDSSASPFREVKSSWNGERPPLPPPVQNDGSLPGGSRGGSSGGAALESGAPPRRPRFVAPRTPPAEHGIGMGAAAGASSRSSASSSKSSSNNAAERKPPVRVAARTDGPSAPRVGPETAARRPRRRATADCVPPNLHGLRRPEGAQDRHGLSTGEGNVAEGVDYNKWDAAMERYRREQRAAAEEATPPAAAPSGREAEATRGPSDPADARPRRRSTDEAADASPTGLVVERDARPGSFFGLPVAADLRGCPSDSVSSMSSVDSYVRKCARLRERKRRDLKARLEGEASVIVEASMDEEGSLFAAASFDSFRKGRHPFASGGIVDRLLALDEKMAFKAKRRPSAGTSRTEAESTASSLLCDYGEEERPIYIRTRNGTDGPASDLDVSALSSSVRCADIDEDIDNIACAKCGAIDAICGRTAVRPSRRRASFTGLQGALPDPDLGAEWRGHARRQSGERRCDAPDAPGEGMDVRKKWKNGGRRASFDCWVPTFRSEERGEEGAVLRRMFAEHTAFLEGVAGRYDGRGGGGQVHGQRVEI